MVVWLEGSTRGWKVARRRTARHVHVSSGIHGDVLPSIVGASPHIGTKDRSRSIGVQLEDEGIEGVIATLVAGIKGPRRGGKVVGGGVSRHVGVACVVDGDRAALLVVASAQQGGIHKCGATGVELCHKCLRQNRVARIERPCRGGEIPRVGHTRHITIARCIYSNVAAKIIFIIPQESTVQQVARIQARGRIRVIRIVKDKRLLDLLAVYGGLDAFRIEGCHIGPLHLEERQGKAARGGGQTQVGGPASGRFPIPLERCWMERFRCHAVRACYLQTHPLESGFAVRALTDQSPRPSPACARYFHIQTRVEVVVSYTAPDRDVSVPFGWIIPDKVGNTCRQSVEGFDMWMGIAPGKAQPHVGGTHRGWLVDVTRLRLVHQG